MRNNLETHAGTVKALPLVLTQNVPHTPVESIAVTVEKGMSQNE